jgi:hypothetical protein
LISVKVAFVWLCALTVTKSVYAQYPLPNVLNTNCPGLPTVRMSGSSLVGSPPQTSALDDDPVRSLVVRITTSGDFMSGTSDDVWLDVGPKAWRIGNNFTTGSTQSIVVDLTTKDDGIDIPDIVPLTMRDLTQVRVEKKGLCGLTDAPDSVASLLIPGIPTPASTVAALEQQVKYAQYALDQQQRILDHQQDLLSSAASKLNDAQQSLNSSLTDLSTIPGKIAEAKNQALDVQRQILQAPPNILQNVCHSVSTVGRVILGVLTGGASELHCAMTNVVNPVWQGLTDRATSLLKTQSDLQGKFEAAGIQHAAALQTISTTTAVKAALEAEKLQQAAQYALLHNTLLAAQATLGEAHKLAAAIPFPNFQFPTPGQWKITHVALIANGHELGSFDINETLKQRHSEWSAPLRSLSVAEQFANGLRVNLNKASTESDENIARVSTVFKISDISGWKTKDVRYAHAIGVLKNAPSPGTDDFVSLDLQLERIEAMNTGFDLDEKHDIKHPRFIRVEYKNRDESGHVDTRYSGWPVGTRLVVDAPVLWDTDRNGFYELHPDQASQVSPLAPGASGATSSVVLWWRRLFGRS